MKKLFLMCLCISLCNGADIVIMWENAVWEQATDIFADIREETAINIRKKRICSIPDTVDLPKLRSLCLTRNKMVYFGNPSLVNLQWLKINYNKCKTIDHIKLPNLEIFLARHNLIKHIDAKKVLENLPKLLFIDISYNPIPYSHIYDLERCAYAMDRKIKIIADHMVNDGENIKRAHTR